MDEQQIRADERRRIADIFEQVATSAEDSDLGNTLRELARVLRTDFEELVVAGLMKLADDIIAEESAAR